MDGDRRMFELLNSSGRTDRIGGLWNDQYRHKLELGRSYSSDRM